ncbi:HAMP domain-containing sensor histidine kinase [Streptomyces sp. NPDC050095]|uniref:sensor histidine kinase n=1 Tax=unclassified Streptomyces TaxID=2593676 RepID=UPI00343109A2
MTRTKTTKTSGTAGTAGAADTARAGTGDDGLELSRAARAVLRLADLQSATAEFRDATTQRQNPPQEPTYHEGNEVPEQLRDRLGSGTAPVTWYDTRKPLQGPTMWAAARTDGTVLAVAVNMTGDQLGRAALDRHMRYAALAMLAVVVPLTLLAAELTLRRLRRVAGTARRIRHGELDARSGRAGHDEIGEISLAVDHMADALQERLHGEQRFTADVAHELRTPLTGLVTAAALLPESEATDLVRDRVRVLRGLVDDLLEISRLDSGVEEADAQPVPLGELVTDAVRRMGLPTKVDVIGDPVLRTDPRRLDRIVTNLIVNAHRHGAPPVQVTVDASTVTVRDHGPGFPADLLRHGPQRFRTGAAERGHGHGLGLTIAFGQAQVVGARLELRNSSEGGAVAVLSLPDDTPGDLPGDTPGDTPDVASGVAPG